MAEALLRAANPKLEVRSAGTLAMADLPAAPHAVEVLDKRGIDLGGHQSQPLTTELAQWADLILTMTENHRHQLVGLYPSVEEKTYTLRSYVGLAGDISDPFGGSTETYEATANELAELIEMLNEKLRGEQQ